MLWKALKRESEELNLSFIQKLSAGISGKHGRWIVLAGVLLLYPLFLSGLSTNPPGFYVDESCIAYNGYLIATTGKAENGDSFPLFVQCYSGNSIGYAHPTDVYALAAMYLFVSPSILSARILAATVVFIAMILLGLLAARITKRRIIGGVVALTGMATPWLFEISRLVLDNFVFVFSVVLFLFFLFNAHKSPKWRLLDSILLAVSLALITYSYTSGRLLAPAFAFGMLLFAVNRAVIGGILRTWAIYFITLVPLIILNFTNEAVITKRFKEVTYILPDRAWSTIAWTFVTSYFADLSPRFLLTAGDPLQRHHITGVGEIYVATFILAVAGIILILFRYRHDPWWRFIVFGLFVSVVPGAITVHRHHTLRLLAFPVFFLILTIPTLSWLLGDSNADTSEREPSNAFWRWSKAKLIGTSVLVLLMVLTGIQAVSFHKEFRRIGPERRVAFDADYPIILADALAQPMRPIYLKDGMAGPAYIDAYWYATMQGIDLANFYHLAEDEPIPSDALILSSDMTCANCKVIAQKSVYLLYKTLPASGESDPSNAKLVGKSGNKEGQFMRPRGVAADNRGNFYIADTGNHRVQKFDSDGAFVLSFGVFGKGVGELNSPNGIAVDSDGNVYVTDAANHKLIKFGPDGDYQSEWKGDELGFYGPRDIAVSPDGKLYIVDQGRSRIVIFDPATETFTPIGSSGKGEGQFGEPMGIAIGDGLVFVTESGNRRIQVLDLDGKYVRQWPVEVWEQGIDSYPDCVFDTQTDLLYVTSGITKDVIAFDKNGNQMEDDLLDGNIKLNKPASICLSEENNNKTLIVLDITDSKVAMMPLGTAGFKK